MPRGRREGDPSESDLSDVHQDTFVGGRVPLPVDYYRGNPEEIYEVRQAKKPRPHHFFELDAISNSFAEWVLGAWLGQLSLNRIGSGGVDTSIARITPAG